MLAVTTSQQPAWDEFLAPLLEPALAKDQRKLRGLAMLDSNTVLYSQGCLAGLSGKRCTADCVRIQFVIFVASVDEAAQFNAIFAVSANEEEGSDEQAHTVYLKGRPFFMHHRTHCTLVIECSISMAICGVGLLVVLDLILVFVYFGDFCCCLLFRTTHSVAFPSSANSASSAAISAVL